MNKDGERRVKQFRVPFMIFCLSTKWILKNVWSHAVARKKFYRLSGGSGSMLPWKSLKKYCSGLAEIAFLEISDLR